MRNRRNLAVAICALALIPAGCGGDDDEPTTQDPQANPTSAAEDPGAGGAPAEGTIEIVMKGFQFEPKEATVKVGQTVVWRNEDDDKHDAFSEEAGLDTEDIGKNGTVDYKPDKGGTINYICSIHPSMKATLIVEG